MDAEGVLRLRLRAQAAVIARVKDGWRWTDRDHEEPGSWRCTRTHLRRVDEPMSEDEQQVVYGQAPTAPSALNAIEQDIVRMAADWLERTDPDVADEAEYARVQGLLLIIDRLVPQGAVRLDQAPEGAPRG